ncbi:jg24605, partial [Pararge aegeria aegeria]
HATVSERSVLRALLARSLYKNKRYSLLAVTQTNGLTCEQRARLTPHGNGKEGRNEMKIRNEEISRRTRVTDKASQSQQEETIEVGVPRFWNGDLAPVYATLVDPPRGGQMTSNKSHPGSVTLKSIYRQRFEIGKKVTQWVTGIPTHLLAPDSNICGLARQS